LAATTAFDRDTWRQVRFYPLSSVDIENENEQHRSPSLRGGLSLNPGLYHGVCGYIYSVYMYFTTTVRVLARFMYDYIGMYNLLLYVPRYH
jgi:hypothetical protein